MLADRTIWFNIASTEGVGPSAVQRIWNRLLAMRAGPDVLLEMDETSISAEFKLSTAISARIVDRLVDPIYEPMASPLISLILPGDEDFPGERFSSSVPPLPPVLWAAGERRLLSHGGLTMGIAGARDASEEVMELAFKIAKEASNDGVLIVSGLAQGVDSAAHQGALVGRSGTVGVMASGILRHSGFTPEDMDSTCLISQFAPEEVWSGPRAMARNSTIAALSDRVVVCASGLSGGSWEMAQLCLKKRKRLYVLDLEENESPGNQTLIRAGALPVSRDQLEKAWAEDFGEAEQDTLF